MDVFGLLFEAPPLDTEGLAATFGGLLLSLSKSTLANIPRAGFGFLNVFVGLISHGFVLVPVASMIEGPISEYSIAFARYR